MEQVAVRDLRNVVLVEFLQDNDFLVEKLTDTVLKVSRTGEQPVFISKVDKSLYFEIDLGSIKDICTKEFYFKLLDLNTEILPVSIGIDTTNEEDNRLVLVESREYTNLDNNEILSVFGVFELAVDKVESILSEFVK